MPHSEYDDDEAYESVDEDAELELSCALHDLAERVKMFEENMKGRLRISGIDGDNDDEEIGEDIPEVDEDHGGGSYYGYASPQKRADKKHSHRRCGQGAKRPQTKQQDDDDDGNWSDDVEDDDEEEDDAKSDAKALNNERNEWDEQNEREELSEMKDNISKLLQGFKEQAKALEANNQ